MNKLKATIILCVFVIAANAQSVDYARNMVEELASAEYHGRGYVKKGDAKAAKFISKQFKTAGLKDFNGSYYQKYSFPINTLPGKLTVKINDIELTPGKDYIISLSSQTTDLVSGISDLRFLGNNPDSLLKITSHENNGNFILISEKNTRGVYGNSFLDIPAVAVVTDKSPYWHVSNGGKVEETTWLKIHKESIPKNPETIEIKFKNKFIERYQTQNVVGWVEGSKYPDKYYVFTAHYDHLGMMGNSTYYPGANDNASGTAMIMDLARYFSLEENKPEYSIVFIAFSGEESGLHGSRYFADNPLIPLMDVQLVINLDMVGSGSDGITVVNGKLYPELISKMNSINKDNSLIKDIKLRGESCNSDHCAFYQKGVPSIFIYTRGKELQEYHTVDDTSDNFPFTCYNGLFELLTKIATN